MANNKKVEQTREFKYPIRSMAGQIISRDTAQDGSTIIELSVASDAPYLTRDYWTGEQFYEVLPMTSEVMDLARTNFMNVLWNHSWDGEYVGKVEGVSLPGNGTMRAKIRFSKNNPLGILAAKEVADSMLGNVSIGYQPTFDESTNEAMNGYPLKTATRVELLEISLLSVPPADASVGVGRSLEVAVRTTFSEKPWTKPNLSDFTDSLWDDLSASEKSRIGKHFAYAPSDAATYDELKLPYREPSKTGVGDVNIAAVRNVLARLDQTTSIPETEKTSIRNKMEALLKEYNDAQPKKQQDTTPAEMPVSGSMMPEEMASAEATAKAVVVETVEVKAVAKPPVTVSEAGANSKDANREKPSPAASIPTITIRERSMENNTGNTVGNGVVPFAGKNEKYDINRAIRSILLNERCDELELSSRLAPGSGRGTSFYLPIEAVFSTKGYNLGDNASGGYLAPTVLGNITDALRPTSVVIAAGADVRQLSGVTFFPKRAAITAGWVAEQGAATETSSSWGGVTLTPHRLSCFSAFDEELAATSQIDMANDIVQNMALTFGTYIDVGALRGTGTTQPTGILNTTALASSSACSGSAWTYANAGVLYGLVGAGNGIVNPAACAYVTSPSIYAAGSVTSRYASGSGTAIIENGRVLNFPVMPSTNLSTSAGDRVLFGDFSQVIVGFFGPPKITIDRVSLAEYGKIKVVQSVLVDVGVRNIQSFALSIGLV